MHDFLTTFPAAILAQETTASKGAPGWITFLPLVLVFGIFYFLVIRPDKKRRAQRKDMVDALTKNDHVVTIGGIHGVVKALDAEEVVVLVDDSSNVRMKFSRNAISEVKNKDVVAG